MRSICLPSNPLFFNFFVNVSTVLFHGSPASNISVHAKKHIECFKDGSEDGKGSNAFDAGRFVHCGKNYQDGFLKGGQSAGNSRDTCESNEDSQDNEPAN